MATWLNHVAIKTPQNGTSTHTVDPSSGTVGAGSLFTPTAGRLLVVVAEGSVTSTTPSTWTLPSGGSAVNNTGLYVWYLASAVGGDTFTTTHNSSNYAVVFDIYEFAAGAAFDLSVAATGVSPLSGAGPTLSGLTDTKHLSAAAGLCILDTSQSELISWSDGVEAADVCALKVGAIEGYSYGLAYLTDSVLSSWSSAAGFTGGSAAPDVERLVFSLDLSAAPDEGEGPLWRARVYVS